MSDLNNFSTKIQFDVIIFSYNRNKIKICITFYICYKGYCKTNQHVFQRYDKQNIKNTNFEYSKKFVHVSIHVTVINEKYVQNICMIQTI